MKTGRKQGLQVNIFEAYCQIMKLIINFANLSKPQIHKLMVKISRTLAGAGLLALSSAVLFSCGEKKDYKKVTAQAEQTGKYISGLSCPIITESDVSYAEGGDIVLTADVDGKFLKAGDVTKPVMKYFTSVMMSENKGKGLDEFINTLADTGTSLKVVLTNGQEAADTFALSGADFKKMAKTSRTEMNPSGVKNDLCILFDDLKTLMSDSLSRSDVAIIDPVKFQGGFFEVNIVFPTYQAFSNLKLPGLKMRSINFFKNVFGEWGDLREPVFGMMDDLMAEGITVAFRAKDSDKYLKTTIVWGDLY